MRVPRPDSARSPRAAAVGIALVILALAAALSGCGGSSSASSSSVGGSTASDIAAANKVNLSDFPATDGSKTLAQIQKEASAKADANVLPASNDFVASRENRLPFGLFDLDRNAVWGPTVMYFAEGTDTPAYGPLAATAHALDVPAKYRSTTSQADYATIGNGYYTVHFTAPNGIKQLDIMTLTKNGSTTQAATSGIILRPKDPSPAPGQAVPAIDTPTVQSAGGDISKIDTRVPHDNMHSISLRDALKQHKPIVLIFATPALCASRVCGPVVDVASEVQAKEGKNVIFIHNEIYKNNDVNAGYRPQVTAFGLTSEPFTFIIGPNGRVVQQLQGPFDTAELEAAINKAKAAK